MSRKRYPEASLCIGLQNAMEESSMLASEVFAGNARPHLVGPESPAVNAQVVEVTVDGSVLRFSAHALRRAQQRGIALRAILLALQTRPVFSRGDMVFRITDRFLMRIGHTCLADRLRGLTVIVTGDGVIRTVMWDRRSRRTGCLRRGRFPSRSLPRCRCPFHQGQGGRSSGAHDIGSSQRPARPW